MAKLFLFNKPFQVLSQFTSEDGKATLADYISVPDIYAAGRLDYDSEGLLLLTDTGSVQHVIASPKFKLPKTYWVQVEGEITADAVAKLCRGVELKDGITQPAQCEIIPEPEHLWPRVPPIRERANIPTSWIALTIHEGKNRQVRRMTAAVGFPTLRLIRYAIGPYTLDGMHPGNLQETQLTPDLEERIHGFEQRPRTSTPPHRRRTGHKGRPVSGGKRVAGRGAGAQPARRPR
jgi:23S rRNA pseudouridine2457 synthase